MTERMVISGGLVVDGTGRAPFVGDVAVEDGRIVSVGGVAGPADRVVDAEGALVTPGWVDIHTHYDGQVLWDHHVSPSSGLGTTTVVISNCGVGFAPVRPAHRRLLIELMEGVEDIPASVLDAGLAWDWESHGDYLDAVDRVARDVDVGTFVPHAPLRLYVMGERGAVHTERATDDEVAQMAELAREAVLAGALGFSTSRSKNHRSSNGEVIGTLTAPADELAPIAAAVGSTGRGVFQFSALRDDLEADFALMRQMVDASGGRPLMFSLIQESSRPLVYREALERLASMRTLDVPITAQVAARPVGFVVGLECSSHPFTRTRAFRALDASSISELVTSLRRDDTRASILDEYRSRVGAGGAPYPFDRMFTMTDTPDYYPPAETSVAARAAAAGVSPEELSYDLLLGNDGREKFFVPHMNWDHGDEAVREMLTSPDTILGLGDGGAHLGLINDSSFPTYLLTYWCRDRSAGTLDLADVVRRTTSATAKAVGLDDRGTIAPGYRADLNVIDHERLALRRPEIAHDLPANGRRLLQTADGYLHTFVAGVETYRHGQPTGELPGRLIRSGQPTPSG